MRVWALLVSLVCLAACSAPRSTPDTRASVDPVTRNVACEGCHRSVASEWRASLHRAAHDAPEYQEAFAIEPLPFCTSCHAPEANASKPEPARAAIGVGCITCHDGPHGTRATRACASCHEFTFPDGHGKMQLTATEHAASPHAGTRCEGCHMPKSGGHRDHRFVASRVDTLVKRAARVRATRTTEGIELHFEPDLAGHAFPTGDIFRRVRIVVESGDQHREVLLSRKSKLGEERDDRLFVDGKPKDVRVPLPPGPARWRVLYERVAHPTTLDESKAEVIGSIEVASGTL